MKTSTLEFLQKLRKFVQDEADAQYRALDKQWSHPLQERVAKGRKNVHVVEEIFVGVR